MIKIIFILFFISHISIFSQSIFSQSDVEICNNKFDFAAKENLSSLPINEIMIEISKTFVDTKYEAFTLEKGDREQLVIHLSGLDCYTFFESSLVFARCVKLGNTTFEHFQKELENTRYRNGKIERYPSRLHYASDWLYDNNDRNIIKDITKMIGGVLYTKKIDFMSSNKDSYKRLKNNNEFVEIIAEIEKEITKRDKYYIPQNFIECVESKIKTGDIILLTTNIKGLDISHTGMAIEMPNGRIHFIHAPSKGKKVQITDKPLSEYVRQVKKHTGIMVVRPLEPKN